MGTVLAFFVLGEQPSVWDLGAIGVVAGLVLVVREGTDSSKSREAVPPGLGVPAIARSSFKPALQLKRLRSHALPLSKLDS